MLVSFLGAATYQGQVPRHQVSSEAGAQAASAQFGRVPAAACDREIASRACDARSKIAGAPRSSASIGSAFQSTTTLRSC